MAKGAIVAGNDTMHGELIRLLREAAETAKREPEAEAVSLTPQGRGSG
jgi:hypothetical protein